MELKRTLRPWAAAGMLVARTAHADSEPDCESGLRDTVQRSPLAKSARAYSQREGRCEGTYAQKLSNPGFLQIASLTTHFSAFKYDAPLIVSWGATPASEVRVAVAAISLESVKNYRMDARARAGTSFTWPTDELKAQGLTRNDLGVSATFQYQAGPSHPKTLVYIPVDVSQKREPPPSPGTAVASSPLSLHLLVIPNKSMSRLVLTSIKKASAPGEAETELELKPQRSLLPQQGAVKRVPLPPLPRPEGPLGEYFHVTLKVTLSSETEHAEEFWFYLPPAGQSR